MYCRHCGNELLDGSVFCSKCGQKQESNSVLFHKAPMLSASIPVAPELLLKISLAVLSGVIVLTAFLPWVRYDYMSGVNLNLIDHMQEYFSERGAMKILAIFAAVFAVISLLVHAYTIYRAFGYLDNEANSAIYASVFTILVAILMLIVTGREISRSNNSWMYANAHHGAGNIICLLLSVGQFVLAYKTPEIIKATTRQSKGIIDRPPVNTTACRFCGQRFAMNGYNKCPHCGRSQLVSTDGKPRTIVCPHCKHLNPFGTVFCEKCQAQIGQSETSKLGVPTDSHLEFCEMCGTKVSPGDTACPHCGNIISRD